MYKENQTTARVEGEEKSRRVWWDPLEQNDVRVYRVRVYSGTGIHMYSGIILFRIDTVSILVVYNYRFYMGSPTTTTRLSVYVVVAAITVMFDKRQRRRINNNNHIN